MKKAELEAENKELKEKVETLEDEITGLEEAYSEMEEAYSEMENKLYEYANNPEALGIKNINNFRFRLKVENLYTEELENFIEYYLKYHNE